jgi:CheY-like chemotaxis protein
MEFRPERVDLKRLIGEVRDILRGLAASKRLRVETQLDPEVAFAVVDPARLKQVLYNYVSNAIKFTPEGGLIIIRIAAQGPDLFRLDVEDTGIGIAPEHLGKLFVEFQQLDASAAKKFQGTGLGLALTKRIVEAHGGRVEVRSTPGKGSTFSAILPRAMTAAPQLQPPAVLPAEANRPVLVVDDDPAALKLVETTLRQMGYRSVCARSAEEALQAAEADPPAIVVVDLLMPVVDGFEFISRFTRLPAGRGVPIIIWTMKDLSAGERETLRASTQAIVSKSGIADLIEKLRPFLGAATDGAHGR